MKRTNLFLTLLVSVLFAGVSLAQGVVTGVIKDTSSHEALVGATVAVKGTTIGATANLDGSFSLKVPYGTNTLEFNYVGYKTITMSVTVKTGQTKNLGTINLYSSTIGLAEINVFANVAIDRKTPVALSVVSSAELKQNLGTQGLPQILNRTPGVYATRGSGGFGDGQIYMRGFSQRNITVLINGIPVNDMEDADVYWSDWSGLGNDVQRIQVQRGLGASKLAINSVGGTINIITKGANAQRGGFVSAGITSYGNKKYMFGVNTGIGKHGYAVTFIGTRTTGPGYVDAAYVDAWSYFFSVDKSIGKNNRLELTGFSSPQKHGQREHSQYSAQTFAQEQQNGVKYNPNWGYIGGGQMLNEENNYFNEPQFALNWYYTINQKNFLATSAYVSIGRGGGSGYLGRNDYANHIYMKYGPSQNALGQRNWDYAVNANSLSTTGSYGILRNDVNNHFWVGVLSTLHSKLSDNLSLIAGIDGRKYTGEHYRDVRNLLGGSYWNDAVNPDAKVGDIIGYNDKAKVNYFGLFSQLEYSGGNLDAFIAGTISNTWFGRIDPYDFALGTVPTLKAKGVSLRGYNLKVGGNYNLSASSNIFVNAGYYSRAPLSNYVYINYSNTINPKLANSKVIAGEFGYGLKLSGFTMHLNAYYTAWNDKWGHGTVRYTAADGSQHESNVYFQGLNELHTGVEFQAKAKLSPNLQVGAFGSFGDWRYTKNTQIALYDQTTHALLGTGTVYTKGLKIPNDPQTQIGLTGRLIVGNFTFGAQYNYNADLYAGFNPLKRQTPNDYTQSYKLPSYGVVNSFAQYKFQMAGFRSTFLINANNLFNANYAIFGWDNISKYNGTLTHSKNNFVGFWGFKRNFDFSLEVYF